MSAARRLAILGLYRSGSTALAGVLHHLGVDLGPPFYQDYYESAWLAQELRRWWDEPRLQEKVGMAERVALLRSWVEERERAGVAWVGAKHPLLSLCGEDLVEAWGRQTSFLWAFRPLQESIRSLEAKGWFANAEWLQRRLWDVVQRFLQGQEHQRVTFADLLNDPAAQVQRLIDSLHLSPSREQVRTAIRSVQPTKSLLASLPPQRTLESAGGQGGVPALQSLFELAAHLNGNLYRVYQLDGYRMYLNVSESLMMAQRACGLYEPHKRQLLRQTLRPGMTFLDIGANKGDFALLAASRVGPQGRVLAFEPHPDNTYWIRQSAALNPFPNLTVVEAALSNEPGQATLFQGSLSGQHSLLRQTDGQRGLPVHTYRLDDYLAAQGIGRVDAMKIDVEGAEWPVLQGAYETLRQWRPVVYLDVHQLPSRQYSDIYALFRNLGYLISRATAPAEALAALAEMPDDLFIHMP